MPVHPRMHAELSSALGSLSAEEEYALDMAKKAREAEHERYKRDAARMLSLLRGQELCQHQQSQEPINRKDGRGQDNRDHAQATGLWTGR